MAGRIVERKVDLGMAVGRDNLETELFVIADLDRVWVELAVSPADLPLIKEGTAGIDQPPAASPEHAEGKIVFISPVLDKDTRSARVVAEIRETIAAFGGPAHSLPPQSRSRNMPVALAVPTSAIQTIGGDQVVFVRTSEGLRSARL